MKTLKRIFLFASSIAFIGGFVQFFIMILADVNQDLFVSVCSLPGVLIVS